MAPPPPPGPGLLRGLVARLRSLTRGLLRRDAVEADMREEFRAHIEMRTDDLVRRGIARREAARRARLEFGHVETHRERARAARGLRAFDRLRFSWLDIKLGMRMLGKHPWLTLAAVFALAVGIPVGLAPVHLARALEAPIPEDPGNRVRALRWWDPASRSPAAPRLDDYTFWAARATSFSAMAAFRTSTWNVASDDGRAAPVAGAVVTASAFDILGRPPLLGRTLDAADQRPGAPDVVVLGHDLWASRFGADPGVVGQTVRIGAHPHTVVGVMGQGFLFPNREQLWLPLREARAEVDGGRAGGEGGGTPRGGAVRVIGRLAPQVTAAAAQAEVGALGRPDPAAATEADARLRAEVVPFALAFVGLPRGGLASLPEFPFIRLLAWVLLLVACGNVAMLVFARTATRFRELAIRSALGAGRGRIVAQLFAEALILALLAAGLGLMAVHAVLGRINLAALAGEAAMPYWLSLGVTGSTVVRTLALAAVSATVAGVIPALRLTGKGIQESIRRAEAGRSGIRFGGVTSALIVADVALSVVAVGCVLGIADRMRDRPTAEALAGIRAEEWLAVEVRMPDGDPRVARVQRVAATQGALVERLRREPGVRGVAVADALPRMDPASRPFEVETADGSAPSSTRWVRTVRADFDFFDALEQPMQAGRAFTAADLDMDAAPILVNTVFVEREFGGRDALGRRVRFPGSGEGADAPWHPIIGVVGHLGTNMVNPEGGPAVYLPAAPGTLDPMQIGIHVGASPERLASRIREIAGSVDPELIVGASVVLSDVRQGDWYLMVGVAAGLVLLVGVLVALAVSGIYAMISFSVSERTREIGIRTALGAPRGSLVVTILRRTLVQLGLGALLGLPLSARFFVELGDPSGGGGSPFLAFAMALGLAVAIVTVIGLVACLVPTRRVLGIQPGTVLAS